jgi:hypothetical protein
MALVLLQYIGMGSSYSTCIYVRVCFIQRTYVQPVVSAIYSTSVVDKDIDDCFLLSHDNKQSPNSNAAPLVLRRSSIQPVQSAFV